MSWEGGMTWQRSEWFGKIGLPPVFPVTNWRKRLEGEELESETDEQLSCNAGLDAWHRNGKVPKCSAWWVFSQFSLFFCKIFSEHFFWLKPVCVKNGKRSCFTTRFAVLTVSWYILNITRLWRNFSGFANHHDITRPHPSKNSKGRKKSSQDDLAIQVGYIYVYIYIWTYIICIFGHIFTSI